MSDAMTIIDNAIAQHYDIKENLKLTGDSVTDIEALFILHKAYSGWTQSSIQELSDRQKRLLQAISAMELGLKRHFSFEEKYLPPLFGETLMKALLYEHHEIAGQIENAKKTLSGFTTHGQNQSELLSRKSAVQEIIGHLLQMIEEHANHEEIILKMIKKSLDDSPGK
jgi:hemerythrin